MQPELASRPFSKNRDGFVMAEGAGALVLEDYDAAVARGAEILAVIRGVGEQADDFHRTRSKPDGSPVIGAMRQAPGLAAEDVLAAITTISFDIAGLELYLPLLVGARVELLSRDTASDGPSLIEALRLRART